MLGTVSPIALLDPLGLVPVEGVIVVTLVVGYVLWWTIRGLARSRPDFRIAAPITVGVGLRLAAIAGLGSLGLASTLRGGDELTYLSRAQFLATQPLGHGDLPHGVYQLHTVILALQ